MGMKTKVKVGEKWLDGEEIEYKIQKEDWNIYELEDGTTIKFKSIVTKIVRTEEYHPQRNDPIYSVSSRNVVEAIVPEKLKKKE